jgi:hypothetical protein
MLGVDILVSNGIVSNKELSRIAGVYGLKLVVYPTFACGELVWSANCSIHTQVVIFTPEHQHGSIREWLGSCAGVNVMRVPWQLCTKRNFTRTSRARGYQASGVDADELKLVNLKKRLMVDYPAKVHSLGSKYR